MKAINPSLREKKRYICVQTENLQENISNILSRIEKWVGQKNYGLSRVQYMKAISNDSTGIISCNNKQYDDVRTAITLVDFPVKVFFCSGSLKKAKEALEKGEL
jgi:RNase P/RNase MRP subunit POP5